MFRNSLLISAIFIFLSTGCYYDKEETLYPAPALASGCDTAAVSFATTIRPLVNRNCTISGCHNRRDQAAGIILEEYNQIKAKVDNGSFGGSINHLPNYSPMPKNAQRLQLCEIEQVNAWIRQGARNN